jgi:hypothetical protein
MRQPRAGLACTTNAATPETIAAAPELPLGALSVVSNAHYVILILHAWIIRASIAGYVSRCHSQKIAAIASRDTNPEAGAGCCIPGLLAKMVCGSDSDHTLVCALLYFAPIKYDTYHSKYPSPTLSSVHIELCKLSKQHFCK